MDSTGPPRESFFVNVSALILSNPFLIFCFDSLVLVTTKKILEPQKTSVKLPQVSTT